MATVIDAVSIGQIITSVLAGTISFVALNKDLRAKTQALNREARLIRAIVIILTFLSIVNIVISSYSSDQERQTLKHSIDELASQNTILRRTIDSNSIQQSKLITESQRESAKELIDAADELKGLINGTDSVPIFRFIRLSATTFTGSVFNYSSRPAYKLLAHIANYDKLLGCKFGHDIQRKLMVDSKCIDSVSNELPELPYLNVAANATINLPLPRPLLEGDECRYVFYLTFNGKTYEEQAICKIVNNKILQADRIFETQNNKVLRKWVATYEDPLKIKDWDKEFPLPLGIYIGKLDF